MRTDVELSGFAAVRGGLVEHLADRARRLAARDRGAAAYRGAVARGTCECAPRLAAFAAEALMIRAECEACRRKVDAPAGAWLARLGDVDLAAMERRLVCARCGERELIDARPLYGGPGRIAVHSTVPVSAHALRTGLGPSSSGSVGACPS